MKIYESAKIELLSITSLDIISTSYPSPDAGTESPILPTNTGGFSIGDSPDVASNY